MSATARQLPRSKFSVVLYLIGAALIGIALLGFIYSFLPTKTKAVEIDLGSKLATMPGMAMQQGPEETNAVRMIAAAFSSQSRRQTPPLQLPGNCAVRGIPGEIAEGKTTLKLQYTCNGRLVDPRQIKLDWTITPGRVSMLSDDRSVLGIDTSGLAGKRVVLTAYISGCGPQTCQRRYVINVTKAATSSPSPTVSPTPSPRMSPSPSEEASPSPTSTPAASPEASASATATPGPVDTPLGSMFGPGRNGSLTVSWPTTIARGWPNLCRIVYEPPRGVSLPQDYYVRASFFLTSTTGLVNEGLRAPFQPLMRGKSEWVIPMEPAGEDGSPVQAQLWMSVAVGREGEYGHEFEIHQFKSRIDNKLLTRNQTLGGSALSGLLGFTFLGLTRKAKTVGLPPPPPSEDLPVSEHFPLPAPASMPRSSGGIGGLVLDTVAKVSRVIRLPPKELNARVTLGAEEDPVETTPSPAPEPESNVKGANTNVGGVTPIALETAEARRYTDVTLYEDHLYPSDSLDETTKVPDDEPLIATDLYTLEVAIRLKRTGILANVPAAREVENPRKEKETLTLHILATPLRGFKITDRLVTIKWPFDQDSESALFRLDIDPSFDTDRPGKIEIRILDEKLDLLDILTLEVAIVPEEGASIEGDMPPRQLVWEDKEPEGLSLAGASHARLASIHVRPVTGGFTFDFVFNSAGGKALNISVFRNIGSEDLNNLLAKVRDFWTRLVITNYAHKLTVSASRFDTYLTELRDLGKQAWSLLFDTRTADQEGASERVGQITAALITNEGGTIQISYAADYGDFIFPWSILHPPAAKDEPVDPLRFWGARYQIEQVTRGPKKDRIDDRPVNVLFALDPSFGDAPSQRKMFDDFQTAAQGGLVVSAPISDQKTLVDQLIRDPAVHLLYFYCHGYAATRPGLLMADGVQSLKRIIEEIRKQAGTEESAAATGLEKLMELTSKMAGESWIYLGDSQIKEADLQMLKFFARPRRPIVFLNMCQSADLVPSMSSGLVHLFLDHNASAVIGTESPMTGVFADAFARKVLDALFAGDNIGTALWKARRHFLLESRNPLGLAYTLYGRADAKLGGRKS